MRNVIIHRAEDDSPIDVELVPQKGAAAGRRLFMLGPAGAERELAVLAPLAAPGTASTPDTPGKPDAPRRKLPVLLGSGLGHAIEALLQRTDADLPIAIVDKEEDILRQTGLRERFTSPRLHWIHAADSNAALTALTRWQEKHGGAPLLPLPHPFYLRLDREWYQNVRTHAEASSRFDFWGKAVQPRFADANPRLLLITSKYFLMGEVAAACARLGVSHRLLTIDDKEVGKTDFVEGLLKEVLTFRPDCILTLNHLGVDREGVLIELLERLQLPLASWFVDNPQLIIHMYKRLVSPWTSLFTWDADNIPELRAQGYTHVHYLPLGTNPERFRPRSARERLSFRFFPAKISFVGNSMLYKVAQKMRKNAFPRELLVGYRETAARFSASAERSIRRFLLEGSPGVRAAYDALPSDDARLEYEAMLTWEATRQYRAACVEQTLPFAPVLVGDQGWKHIFKSEAPTWRLHPEVTYYDELPQIYPLSEINFNCTSQQMKGAVNQRVFDVPAAGAFVLTDWREQMDELLEPGKEVIAYKDPGEIRELVAYYLAHPRERRRVAEAGRRRVLADHTWEQRLAAVIRTMKATYGG